MLSDFYKNKYGKEICGRIFSKGKLLTENIKKRNAEDQFLVKNQIKIINDNLELKLNIDETNWAFDFPGWIGLLEASKLKKKDIMIIGLEPHVERYDFQVTYGLSDKTPTNIDRFSLNLADSNFKIKCHDDSSLIWSNLFEIIASRKQIKELYEQNNSSILNDFLNQFYITDLCHFAPQDKAKAIFDIKNWKKVRFKVAKKFLKTEIELVKPKIILTQGNGVFNELRRITKFKETARYPVKISEKQTWYIRTGIPSDNEYKIVSIPHFGSEMTYETFWKNKKELVRDILFDNKLI